MNPRHIYKFIDGSTVNSEMKMPAMSFDHPINPEDVWKSVLLWNDCRVVLLDTLGKQASCGNVESARNMYLLTPRSEIIWQVFSDFDEDGGPFTNVYVKDEQLFGYRWDGGEYLVASQTGFATPLRLLK